jgi:chromosome segregation ATPase
MATKKPVAKPSKQLSELDRLKNLIARQDDVIAQLQDDVNDQKNAFEVLEDECGQLEDKIESYREIIKTLMEITE